MYSCLMQIFFGSSFEYEQEKWKMKHGIRYMRNVGERVAAGGSAQYKGSLSIENSLKIYIENIVIIHQVLFLLLRKNCGVCIPFYGLKDPLCIIQ